MKHGSAEIRHASMMSPAMGVTSDAAHKDDKSLGTIEVPAKVLDGRDLGEVIVLSIRGVYTAKSGDKATLHLMAVTPAGSKNHADVEEGKMRGRTKEGN